MFDSPFTQYWTLNTVNPWGAVTDETLGNTVRTVSSFDPLTRLIDTRTAGPGGGSSTQNLAYEWDLNGNLERREDLLPGKVEVFTYDALNRLDTSTLNGSPFLNIDYNLIGNIEYKSYVGTYSYGSGGGPHAVTAISGIQSNVYAYDPNGNMTNRDGDAITWYSFNKPKRINYGSAYAELFYGADRQRVKQNAVGYSSGTLHYVGEHFEVLSQGPLQAYLHHIVANGKIVARFTNYNFQGPDTRYWHHDHLGSVVATTDISGAVLSRYEFDVFGVRSQIAGSGLYTQKGFTGHEHLDTVDLIDMNGRVQDPVIGRFISADPFVQAPYYSQSLNRYSYAWNNPLTFTDPSGYQVDDDYCARCVPSFPGLDIVGPTRPKFPAPHMQRLRTSDAAVGRDTAVANTPVPFVISRTTSLMPGEGDIVCNEFGCVCPGDPECSMEILRAQGEAGLEVLHVIFVPDVRCILVGDNCSTLGRVWETASIIPVFRVLKVGKVAKVADVPVERGLSSEARVLDDLGLEKNRTPVRTGEGKAVPDALTSDELVEIKDTLCVSCTRQVRIETDAAAASGRRSVLVTGTNTRVTPQAEDAFDEIIRRDDLGPP